MRKWVKKIYPLGLDIAGQLSIIVSLLGIVFLWSYLKFIDNYWEAVLKSCYVSFEEYYHLSVEYQMPDFLPMLQNCFDIVIWYSLAMLGIVIYNYFYHYGTYKSIYIMCRLPNPWELHIRCWGIPVLGVVCVGIGIILMILGFYCFYCLFELPFECEAVGGF